MNVDASASGAIFETFVNVLDDDPLASANVTQSQRLAESEEFAIGRSVETQS